MIINMNGAKAPETPSPVLQEKTVTPETLPTVIGADEGYDGLSQVTVNPDSQLIPTNIRSGKTIFGVDGTFTGGSLTSLDDIMCYEHNISQEFVNLGRITTGPTEKISKQFVQYPFYLARGNRNLPGIMEYSEEGKEGVCNIQYLTTSQGVEYRRPVTIPEMTITNDSFGNKPLFQITIPSDTRPFPIMDDGYDIYISWNIIFTNFFESSNWRSPLHILASGRTIATSTSYYHDSNSNITTYNVRTDIGSVHIPETSTEIYALYDYMLSDDYTNAMYLDWSSTKVEFVPNS